MKTFLEKQEKGEGFQRLPPYAHARQLPQTVSWGPSIRTLPEAADGLERNPPFGGQRANIVTMLHVEKTSAWRRPPLPDQQPDGGETGRGVSGKFLTACSPEKWGTSCPRGTEEAGATSRVFQSLGWLVQLRHSQFQKVSI